MHRTTRNALAVFALLLLAVVSPTALAQDRSPDAGADDEKHKKHRVQEALQALETAEDYLSMSARRMGDSGVRGVRDAEDQLRRAGQDVDAALGEVQQMLTATKTQRTIDRVEATKTDRPIRQAEELLDGSHKLLTNAEGDFDGHRKQAIQHVEAARERLRPLAENEVAYYRDDRDYDRSRDRRYDTDDDDRDRSRTAADVDLPRDVRRAVDREVPDLRIDDVRRDRDTGAYHIEGRSDRQGRVEMRVGEDGEVLRFERKDERNR